MAQKRYNLLYINKFCSQLFTINLQIVAMFKVLQGAQAQALAGKIINTSQGQFIVGPNGQLLSKQKLLQNNVQGNQTVRLDTI